MQQGNATIGGWLVVAGALGVTVITIIYASAAIDASAPAPASISIETALAATLASTAKLRAAGTIGIVADILLIGGCALLALQTSSLPKRLLWIWLGLSTAIFIAVDALAAQVMPAVAQSTGSDLAAFTLVKRAFDVCFSLGVFTFGAAFLAAALENEGPRFLRAAALITGVLAVVAFALQIFGLAVPLLLGLTVGLAGILGIVFGYRETRKPAAAR
jgi:hypothetical protein